jgi:hypothetical protein
MDGFTRVALAVCGGLVAATPVYFLVALLHAALGPTPLRAELWLLGLWTAAGLRLGLRASALDASREALLLASGACGIAPLVRWLLVPASAVGAAPGGFDLALLGLGIVLLALGLALRRMAGALWS